MPVWAKLTPSTTDIVVEARGAFLGGADAITSSNTFPSLPLIDPETLEFEVNVDGYVSTGGLGGPAILPLSLAKMAQLTQAFPDKAFSGIGGIAEFAHALNYFLLGCGTVQVCTAAMLDHAIGPNVHQDAACRAWQAAMERHGWTSLEDFRGMRRDRVVVHSKIRRPDAEAYHGGYEAEGYASSGTRRLAMCRPPPSVRRHDVGDRSSQGDRANEGSSGTDSFMSNERRLADGRVELVDTARIEASPLYNHDLAPVPLARRNWTTYNYAALWVSMAHCIPTYMLASGLMASGMNWSQALLTILLGNTIVLVPILLNSHPGTKYGIPFPVFARAAYGTLGSNVPALMRALVACGWFGIQAWIGGEALHTFFRTIVPGWPTLLGAGFGGHTTTEWLSFLLFWGLNVYIIYRGMDLLRAVENWAAPFVLVMTGVAVVVGRRRRPTASDRCSRSLASSTRSASSGRSSFRR